MESSSFGRPWSFHSLIVVLSTRALIRLRSAEHGIRRVFSCFCQLSISLVRYSWLKGPVYDRNPVNNRTSPMSLRVEYTKIHQNHSCQRPFLFSVENLIFLGFYLW